MNNIQYTSLSMSVKGQPITSEAENQEDTNSYSSVSDIKVQEYIQNSSVMQSLAEQANAPKKVPADDSSTERKEKPKNQIIHTNLANINELEEGDSDEWLNAIVSEIVDGKKPQEVSDSDSNASGWDSDEEREIEQRQDPVNFMEVRIGRNTHLIFRPLNE